MELHVDIRWLLERQAEALPKHPHIHDFSSLVAAVGRHRVNTPRVGATVDNSWRAAALMHAVIRLRPLPARNALFGVGLVVAYMDAAGEGIDAPYGALIDLARDIDTGRCDAYDAADRIRSWRI
ncbi:toxin Doc [Streptomyces sp. NPDC090052]|uniref:toxin Doc n=1 Tax=unclassified Streptomyces TaxID=2593676 RepID=UPI0013BFE199|nr:MULTISPECIES: toxin Doc [unclassified Streptomyces]NDZ79319.1 toxin Doc [Streptomyces sp. SID10853]WSU40277.1 toxin Doc [Streptomyces sp. NBC_01089]WSV08096.1 toxin Doc [Streptomyces sp. NBC_01020]WSX65744.1 toxin Doc [Streptomyces sp. NBC_00932]MCX4729107.1 toxin Doc [Streptomyces sp. NBC_01306]